MATIANLLDLNGLEIYAALRNERRSGIIQAFSIFYAEPLGAGSDIDIPMSTSS